MSKPTSTAEELSNVLGFALCLAFYLVAVRSMQGLNFDTVFLALYATMLTIFVIKSLSSAFRRD